MYYQSTRDNHQRLTAAQVITQGISPEGGLFVPEQLPVLSEAVFNQLIGQSYIDRAAFILSLFLSDFSQTEIYHCVENAYKSKKFSSHHVTELSKLCSHTYMLELWHGPTCAFKDMALQILPHLLTIAAKKTAHSKKIVILVATSGDTGKAALDGFKDVPNTYVMVFYPEHGVSPMQKRQMITQEGSNVFVAGVVGNFDDAQTTVKQIFTNQHLIHQLGNHQMMFSSANSINWGRLLPQIVYYVSSYCDLVSSGEITMHEPIHVTVPTGNFGNILAAYYAKKMGVPIDKLICASNENNVLTEFINTGCYNKERNFYATNSPSMDIILSSNLERLLYDLSGKNDTLIKTYYDSLKNNGSFTIDESLHLQLKQLFFSGYATQQQTLMTIQETFEQYGYLCDTHTAVALKVARDYQQKTGDTTKMLVVSTASPYKFSASVLSAILDDDVPSDEDQQLTQLQELSNLTLPPSLGNLKNKKDRFLRVIDPKDMQQIVLDTLNIT